MSDVKISSNKSFGIVFFVVFLIISLYPMLGGGSLRIWSLAISFIFLILGLLNSKILSPINKLWFKFGIFFFFVVTPIGYLMRLFKKDVLSLKFNKNNKSYWVKKNGPKSKMKNQF